MERRAKISKWLLALGLVLTSTSLLQAVDQTWDSTGTPNVVDGDNLIIDGWCPLSINPTLTVTTHNKTVTLAQDSTVVSNNTGRYITISVATGHTCTFNVNGDYDLTFAGGSNNNIFNIYQTGGGTVIFKLKGGRTLRFKGSDGDLDSGVRYYSLLAHQAQGDSVGVYFEYDRTQPANENAVISFEGNSLFTFMATTAIASSVEEGGIGIIPALDSDYSGALLLNIEDRAGFVLTGHLYSGGVVDLATLAGHRINMLIKNSGTTYKQRFMVLNGNKLLSQLFSDPTRTRETVTGEQHGFILGPNSELRLENGTYLDYIGTTSNIDPLISAEHVLQGREPSSILKQRNASALTIDGTDLTGSATVRIVMEDESGIFFRSACDATGTWTYAPKQLTDVGLVFTITPTWQTYGAGNIVFEVEAALDILGKAVAESSNLNAINILSREVNQFGGKVEIEGTLNTFPAFTFAASAAYPDTFAQYAKACMFVNDRVNMHDAIIRHDDFVHTVNATNTPTVSEPTYIGGDTFVLTRSDVRPTVNLYNAELRLHTSAAFTGVDLLVTPTASVDTSLTSSIRFYANGRKLDRGTGRALVLGTTSGSYAYDQATVVDASSYLDIYQEYNIDSLDAHDLNLTATTNDHNWITQIPVGADYSTQYSIHTIFLGNASNIQIGSQTTQEGVTLTTDPTLNINSNFFSFMSQGGSIGQPELSATTGQGGIFVDQRGTINMASIARTNFGCMVVKGSPDALIVLPKSKAYFADRVGIAFWDLDLSKSQTVVSSGQTLSDFTLDWMATLKDYDGGFIPFDPTGTLEATVTNATLHHIPVIMGEVDEFQVKRSRLGDQVHLLVNGGNIRDLVFLRGFDSAEAQTGLLVVENDAQVGIGDNATRRDTLEANVVLGINGLSIAANGNGTINLNTDVTVNNVCPIMAGPDFGLTGTQKLYIRSDDPHFIRVKNGGTLDLTSFTSTNHQIVFDGKVQLILEPGAELILSNTTASGGSIFFNGESQLVFEALIDAQLGAGTTVASTDDFRAKIIGTGSITFAENSSCRIYKNAYVGIESDTTYNTSLYLSLYDNAAWYIGDSAMFGGSIQFGNTADLDTTVTVTIEIYGPKALIQVGSQGYIGFGAGIVDKRASDPDEWSIGSLYNLTSATLNFYEGALQHDRIVAGDSDQASLFVIGPATHYYGDVIADTGLTVLGGGNLYLLSSGVTTVHPVVSTTSSSTVGMLASGYLLLDGNNVDYLDTFGADGTSTSLFNLLRTKSALPTAGVAYMSSPRANITHIFGVDYLGYVNGTTLVRHICPTIRNVQGIPVPHSHSLSVGSVAVAVDPTTNGLNNVTDIVF